MELIFRIEAEMDLADIRDYYSKISEKVTNNFFREFFRTLNYIEQQPRLFQERYRGIGIAPLYQYSYGIHYHIEKDKKSF